VSAAERRAYWTGYAWGLNAAVTGRDVRLIAPTVRYAKAAFEGAKDAAGYVAALSVPPPEEKPGPPLPKKGT